MVDGESAYKGCSGCDQGFWHFNVPICIDAIGQHSWEEFWKSVATVEECPLQNVADQVVSVNEVGVCGGTLSRVSHHLQNSEYG